MTDAILLMMHATVPAAAGADARIPDTPGENPSRHTGFGTAFVSRMADGTLTASISTVSGPTIHTCDLVFDGARFAAGAWRRTDSADSRGGGVCTVTLVPARSRLVMSVKDRGSHCGARGRFDATYTRVQ